LYNPQKRGGINYRSRVSRGGGARIRGGYFPRRGMGNRPTQVNAMYDDVGGNVFPEQGIELVPY